MMTQPKSSILYAVEPDLSVEEFQTILRVSTLGERRPVDDLERLDDMLSNANIVVTARDQGKLVGVSRALTDFVYCCYLSDLAVDVAYQKQGIGKKLIDETHVAASTKTTLFLVSAPASIDYYPKIGMAPFACFGILRSH